MNDFKSMEQGEPIALETASPQTGTSARITLEDALEQFQTGDLPYELPPPPAAEPATDDKEVLRQLFNFFLFGKRPAAAGTAVTETEVVPALLHQYRDLTNIRHDYPFCLDGTDPAGAVRTLSQIIDGLAAGITDDSDSGERLRQHIYRIEPGIRELADHDRSAGLLGLWDRAALELLKKSRLAKDKKDVLRDSLARARQSLTDSEMIACDADTPQRVLTGLARLHWRERSAAWLNELNPLVQQLMDLLSIDFNNSPEARDPEHLRATAATDSEINFETLSSILASSRLEHQLPEGRGLRIRAALAVLLQFKPVFDLKPSARAQAAELPVNIDTYYANCADAIKECERRIQLLTDFFRALAIARLELDNHYKEEVHDEYFSQFNNGYLSAGELALCPPVLLSIKCSDLVEDDVNLLLQILNSDMPVKILLQVDELYVRNGPAQQSMISVNWPARLAGLALSLTRAYVLQSPVSRLPSLHQGFLDGLAYNGPALFSIYVGNEQNRASLTRYFDAGSAQESRVFPVFTFNPGKGATLMERLDILNNSQTDRDWPTDAFRYRAADDSVQSLELKFTSAGFLLNDKRFTDQFWCVPQAVRHENMLPLQDYLAGNGNDIEDKIPYFRTVDMEGCIHRVIMTRHVVDAVRECAAYWRHLQELGGVNNSYTSRQVKQEQERLAQEKQQEVDAIREKYQLQLEQDIGRLTQEIVQRIAGQLLQLGETPITVAATPPTQKVSAQAPATAEAAAVPEQKPAAAAEEEEEPAVSLDDPYIDTPLCTTCDDCTKLNSLIFAYDGNKQAYIKDATAGPYRDLVVAAEKCPVKIIHPGKPKNPDEPNLDDLVQRAAKFN